MTPDLPPAPATPAAPPPRAALAWGLPLLFFLATAWSVFTVGETFWGNGAHLALPLLSILVVHEFGHFLAARWHGEAPSLPYFLPLPWGNPFGTIGAVLFLDDRRRSRAALLDIGAAGPLAGLAVALPLLVMGLQLSRVEPLRAADYAQEGQSLAYWAMKRLVLGPMPPGHDVTMHPVLGAAWAGLYVTFLNLLPVGQLDGGHVARALLGRHQPTLAGALMWLPGLLVIVNLAAFLLPWLAGGERAPSVVTVVSAVLPWAMLQALLGLTRWFGGFQPAEIEETIPLGAGRRFVGWGTLAWFLLLFMPAPWVVY